MRITIWSGGGGVFTWSLKTSPIKTPTEPSCLRLHASANIFPTLRQQGNCSTCGRTCTHRLLKAPIWFILIVHYKLKSDICYKQTKHRKRHSSWFPGHRRDCFPGLGVVFHWLTGYFQRELITPVTSARVALISDGFGLASCSCLTRGSRVTKYSPASVVTTVYYWWAHSGLNPTSVPVSSAKVPVCSCGFELTLQTGVKAPMVSEYFPNPTRFLLENR